MSSIEKIYNASLLFHSARSLKQTNEKIGREFKLLYDSTEAEAINRKQKIEHFPLLIRQKPMDRFKAPNRQGKIV